MIAKKVTMRAQRQSSMTGLVNYLTEEQVKEGPEELVRYMTDEQGNATRVGQIRITNCQANEAAWAAAEMRAVQRMNKRAVSDKTYHMIISFPEGEEPNLKTLWMIEDRFCRELGFAEHQRISVIHRDTDNLHLHIAINKIHPKTYRLHEPYYDHRIRSRVCAQLEAELGLTRVNHRGQASEAEARADDMTRHSGVESLIRWIKTHCQADLEQAESWADLRQILRENALELRQRANGFVFVARDGTRCKASSVSRRLSMPALLGRLGPIPNAEAVQDANVTTERAYQRKPRDLKPDQAALFARFRAEQMRHRQIKAERRNEAKQHKDERIAAAKRRAKLERATVKLVSRGLSAKLAYATIRTRLRAELKRASAEYARERRTLQERYPIQTWKEWSSRQGLDRRSEEKLRNHAGISRGESFRVRGSAQESGRDDAELTR